MHLMDSILFGSYLVGVLLLGWAVRGRDRTDTEYYLAGRSMKWLPVGLSVMVTLFSAVNYVALPAEVARYGLYVTASFPVFILVAFPITRIFIPFFHSMRLTSLYEYLERRFDARVRLLAALLFLFWRLLWMGVALLAAARILGEVTGLPVIPLLIAAGLAAALYTSIGGMRAVLWTDVVQFIVLAGSILLALLLALARLPGGPGSFFSAAAKEGLVRPFVPFDPAFLSLDPRLRITLWSGLIGSFVAFLGRYGSDQAVVQRYFAASSAREAVKGFWFNVVCALAALHLLVFLGFAVRMHAVGAGLGSDAPLAQLASLVRSFPAGMTGLVAAGLLAATMSSVDSGAHSCAAVWTFDVHRRFLRRGAPQETGSTLLFNRLLTWIMAGAAVLLALYVGRLGDLFTIINRIVHGLGGPLLALLLAGMFSRRCNSAGVLGGGILGAAGSITFCFSAERVAIHYYAVVTLAGTWVLCWLGSLLAAARGRGASAEQRSWTWRNRRPLVDNP